MELQEIRQIVELMDQYDLSLFHLEKEGFSIKLKKGADFEGQAFAPQTAAFQQVGAPSSLAAAAAAAAEEDEIKETEISSPMVGTFYRSASPDSPPFASNGTEVSDDSVVCIIEAMKVMNEIKAECHGIITKVLVEDGSPVQYGQPLFLVKPA